MHGTLAFEASPAHGPASAAPRGERVPRAAEKRGVQDDLAAMVARGAPIVAGPWVGEVGFELLYWVPFLRWCAERLDVDPDRFIVMSRGGTASWYRPFASRYVDVFDEVSAETFRDQHDARVRDLGEQKQTRVSDVDQEFIAAAMRRAHVPDWSLLHPSRMYDVLNPYWWGHQSSDWVLDHVRYAPLPLPPPAGIPGFAARYVAVKFYFNDCFPADEQNRAFVRDVLRTLAARGPVVALSTGLNIDDHGGARVDEYGVRHLPEGLIRRATCTCRARSSRALRRLSVPMAAFPTWRPFYGVKSLAFYSDPDGFSQKHLHMARSAFDAIGAAGLLNVRDAAAGVRWGRKMTSDPISSWAAVDARARTAKRAIFAETKRGLKLLREKIRNSGIAFVNISAKQLRRASWLARACRSRCTKSAKRRSASILIAPNGPSNATSRASSPARIPIIVGPWLSEVGYEVLYWVPFVRWVQSQFRIAPERLVVVTRGGAASWYPDITTNSVELFDLMSPDEYAAGNAQRSVEDRGTLKQFGVSSMDQRIVADVEKRIGTEPSTRTSSVAPVSAVSSVLAWSSSRHHFSRRERNTGRSPHPTSSFPAAAAVRRGEVLYGGVAAADRQCSARAAIDRAGSCRADCRS